MSANSGEAPGFMARLVHVVFLIILIALLLLLLPLVLTGLAGYFLIVRPLRESWKQQRFDSAVWKRPKATRGDARRCMIRDLLHRDLLLGKSREEVIEMLGEPDSRREGDLAYYVRPSWPKGRYELLIRFDGQGAVQTAHTAYRD
jgi:hypothetical protein